MHKSCVNSLIAYDKFPYLILSYHLSEASSVMEKFFEYAKGLCFLSEESKDMLAKIMQPMKVKKGHELLRPGGVCHHLYFIEEGLTRTWYVKDGKDVTDWISTENSFAVSLISFVTRRPDRRGIETLEPSRLLSITHTDLERLYGLSHEIERLGRLLISHGIVQVQQRFDDLHFYTAAERYKKLFIEHPSLINRVPIGMIASYLGITRETLSRIRSAF
jgi:CRP-like cAMP-binding protein